MYILIHTWEPSDLGTDDKMLVQHVINTDHVGSITDHNGKAIITMSWGKIFHTDENVEVLFNTLNVAF